ncbi:hypothetical protein [Phytohabitans houttuyneae]
MVVRVHPPTAAAPARGSRLAAEYLPSTDFVRPHRPTHHDPL